MKVDSLMVINNLKSRVVMNKYEIVGCGSLNSRSEQYDKCALSFDYMHFR